MATKETVSFHSKQQFFSSVDARKKELTEIKKNLRSVWIFGAGNNGVVIAKHLSENNTAVNGFIDDTPSKINTTLNGIKIISFTDFVKQHQANDYVFISIFNPAVSYQTLLSKFKGIGIHTKHVFSYLTFIQLFNLNYLFLGPVGSLTSYYNNFKTAFDRLTTIPSKKTFLNYLNFQIGLSSETPTTYFFKDLKKNIKNGPVNFIDIGAFDGDTILKFEKEFKLNLNNVYAFEPDVFNYQKLLQLAGKKNKFKLLCFNMAVGKKSEVLSFNSDGNMGSMLSKTGKQLVQCIRIDDIVKPVAKERYAVKIDVEGFELSVLEGMKTLIKKHAPVLIISAYHKTNDVFDIITYVTKQHKYKNINIQQHGADGADLSLYFY